jgi:hypothetical protein
MCIAGKNRMPFANGDARQATTKNRKGAEGRVGCFFFHLYHETISFADGPI